MGIKSLEFACFAVVAIGLFHLAPRRLRASLLFPATSAAFLWLQMPNIQQVALLLLFCVVAWGFIQLVRVRRSLSVLLGALLFVVAAYYAVRSVGSATGAIVGIAYILIRSLQVMLDSWEKPQIAPDLASFLCFLLGWPGLISGPIQRWQDFSQQRQSLASFALDWALFNRAIMRVALGYFMVLVLGDIARRAWFALMPIALGGPAPIALGGAELCYFIYLTFDFIGYTNIVLGLALLIGFRLPENFDNPWLATSYLDFWSRWHITLAGFFKTYAFNPIIRFLTIRRPARRFAERHAAIAFFGTFFLVGLWHGTSWHFAVCGLLLAIGATTNQLARSLRGKKVLQTRLRAAVVNAFFGAITLAYVCFSIMPLWLTQLGWFEAVDLFGIRYGVAGLLLASLVAFGALVPIVILVRGIAAVALPLDLTNGWWLRPVAIGAAIACIQIYGFLYPNTAINFVYQAF